MLPNHNKIPFRVKMYYLFLVGLDRDLQLCAVFNLNFN